MPQQQGEAGPLLRSELVLEQAQGYLGSNSWCVSYPTFCPGGLSSMVGKDPSESYSDCCSDFLERVSPLNSCPGIRSSRSAQAVWRHFPLALAVLLRNAIAIARV